MSRTGLLITLAIAAAVGLVFGLRPDLDLAVSAAFYDPVPKQFPLDTAASVQWLRHGAEWVTILIVASSCSCSPSSSSPRNGKC